MRQRYRLYRRTGGGRYYAHDDLTGKQESLHTSERATAVRLVHSKNEAVKQPVVNLQIARAHLVASDPQIATRSWQWVILETQSAHFLKVLELGTVSTNVYLRRIHNFALDMNWLLWPVLPKKQWPQVRFKQKRAITVEEHQRIIAAEVNPERKTLYQLCWHLGASQGDIANLKGEDVDWTNNTVSFVRKKTGVPVLVYLGAEALNLFKDLPSEGMLFPYLSRVRAGDRATEFKQRCQQLGIQGVTLHSCRYAWAERAKTVGYPERFAQEALGHNSKAVHRAYAKQAVMKIPSLEDCERRAAVRG